MNGFSDDNLNLEMTSAIILEPSPLAYVRPIKTDRGMSYAVCNSDGMQLATFATEQAAWFAAKQNDLEPVLLH
jgi:hypothetical protein